MAKLNIKKSVLVVWFTLVWFMLLANVHAWEVPSYVRLSGGTRAWFNLLEGDLIQPDRTKLGFTDNLGLKQDALSWEHFVNLRLANIHLVRFRVEPSTSWGRSSNESYLKVVNGRVGYDLDFFMTPNALIGAHADVDVLNLESTVDRIRVANSLFEYSFTQTRAIPSVGLHGAYYPTVSGISVRPNFSARINLWDYESVQSRDLELSGAVDIALNQLWTWSIMGGYRIWNIKLQRDVDRADITRKGFFVETSLLF
jgi:hypothetical protein